MYALNMQPDKTIFENQPAPPATKALSPLRAVGALHIQPKGTTP